MDLFKTHSQSSDGSASSLYPSSSTSTQHMDLNLSDFRSTVYEDYGTVELYAFNPLDYPDKSERHHRLEFFLKSIVPSNWPAGVNKITVLSPSYVKDEELGDKENLKADWRELKLTPNQVNFHTVKELALTHKCLRGMWILIYKPCDTEKHDEEWVKVAEATAEGELGMFAKVSDRRLGQNCVICVFTKNFDNKKEVMDLEGKIRHLGVKGQLVFKPSFYTVLRMFAGNEWDLKVGIYTSQWDPVRNCSEIQDKTK